MIKHKIIYIDEQKKEINKFKRKCADVFEVKELYPISDFNEFINLVIEENADAVVTDFLLSESRDDVKVSIGYNGVDIAEELLRRKEAYPCFVLTSHESDAIGNIVDVNYVYPKVYLYDSDYESRDVSFQERVRLQIEHYKKKINDIENRIIELKNFNNKRNLTVYEKKELIKLDSMMERILDGKKSLSEDYKNSLVNERLDRMIQVTEKLLEEIRK